jgi:hypothetical protein
LDKIFRLFCVLVFLWSFSACGRVNISSAHTEATPVPTIPNNQQIQSVPTATPAPTTISPIGKFDFKNFTYPLPRGWQGAMREITLENGKAPLSMKDDDRKIGATYVKTKFGDVTGDGQDEAFVMLKIETGGSALPQIVYIFEWKNEKPELIWYFRTGDRADGGLREIQAENGELIIELYGQDRYIFGDVETMKIVGDEEQLCCPTHFTRNRYKLTSGRFVLQGKRLTYSVAEPNAPPVENMGDVKAEEQKKGKK